MYFWRNSAEKHQYIMAASYYERYLRRVSGESSDWSIFESMMPMTSVASSFRFAPSNATHFLSYAQGDEGFSLIA